VAAGTIEPRRVAVLRGQVQTRDGSPLPGVTLTILGHPEFGQTLTRADGMFDLAVNGGGLLTVRYEKDGFMPVQRQVQAPWRDYAWLPDVILLPYDNRITAIDLTASTEIQVARGNMVADERGTRQATLLFAPGTQATMVLPDGTTQPLTTLHVRATEYTVGPGGFTAMPADLPPTSAYTYAVELSVDEAVAARATTVQFSQPVYVYVENFLDFPVGEIVPAGYYDRQHGVWVASDNGRVIQILRVTEHMADLDTDGDGAADDATTLAALSVTEAERQRLATLYQAGQRLWRVPIPHVTPWDFNWPGRPPDGVTPPNRPPAIPPQSWVPDGDVQCGSIIDCQNQTLGETVAVPGTPFRLHYQSDRVPGPAARRTLDISLTGDRVGLYRSVRLVIEVAGQRLQQRLATTPNLTYTFTWDGRDGYGREVQGEQPVTILIGYDYDSCYVLAQNIRNSFAQPTGGGGDRGGGWSCTMTTFWQRQRGTLLGTWDSRAQQLGGWTLNVHHAYHPGGQTLHAGDGQSRRAADLGQVILPMAGHGTMGYSGDGGPATAAALGYPSGLAAGPDGSLYIADWYNSRIRRVHPDGMITTVVGTGADGYGAGYSGDGGPATQAQLNLPADIALGPDGSLYIADSYNHRIRRVGLDGIITTVAGTGTAGSAGDGGLATQAQLHFPYGVTVGPDASLYLAEYHGQRVRRVSPDGLITTVAGTGTPGYAGDGGPATAAQLYSPWALALGPDGSLYIADISNNRVRRVSPNGRITTVAGNATSGHSGDGGPATLAQLRRLQRIAVGSDASLYIVESRYGLPDAFNGPYGAYIRRVSPDGIITTVAGSLAWGDSGDGGSATQASVGTLQGIAIGPDGSLYVSDDYFHRVRRVGPSLPDFATNDVRMPSPDGDEVYVFDAQGRHLRTLNALTRAEQYQFRYDSAGRLTHIVDGDGLTTSIERDGAGNPTAIVAPFGQRTTLQLDAHGYLARLTTPAGETTRLTSTPVGLLTSLTDANGHASRFTYDALGRLVRDEDAAGGFKTLTRTGSGEAFHVSLITALGRSTTYAVERVSMGGTRRVNTDPRGLQSLTEIGTNGSRRSTAPDGTVTTLREGPDPRFGMQAPLTQALSVTTPSGLTATMTEARTVTLTNPLDLLSVSKATATLTVNGRTHLSTFDAAARTLIRRTPAGRQRVSLLDAQGRVLEDRIDGLESVRFTYDSLGRLGIVAHGSRTSVLTYDGQGRLTRRTDPLGRAVDFAYDAAGRLMQQTLPDGREIRYTYDANGNLTSLTPPGRPSHSFAYNPVDLEAAYVPPALDAGPTLTQYAYNLDRQLVQVTRPDGTTLDFGYDAAGRLSTLTFPRGAVSFDYHPSTGQLATITAPDGGTLTYDYDGSLLTSETWAGTMVGGVQYTYDHNFRLTAQRVNGGVLATFQYDADGLLTQAGALTLSHHPQHGLLLGSTLGQIVDTRTHTSPGELASYQARFGGTELVAVQYGRDALGRITHKTEMLEGQTTSETYAYDLAGRLTTVTRNGIPLATYAYDSNGNRLSATSPDGTITGTYDVQDRLTQYGPTTYTYTANGELQSKTTGDQTTTYTYDALGNLTAVTLPNGTQIEYVIDGRNRRVGKKINGALVQAWLYAGQLTPVAELDGQGHITARFVYGTRANVPEYLIKGGYTYRILTDYLGSPRLVIDITTGHIVQRLAYDAFGRVLFDDNPGFQPFGFAGGLYDPDTQLTRFGARDYDAETGRWTSKDPIRFAGGDLNLYGYVGNNPISYIDPLGLWDTQAAAGYLTNPANGWMGTHSQGRCAAAVRRAINAGGVATPNNPVSASGYQNYLPSVGFQQVNRNGYQPQTGDIAVFPPITGNPHGHIEMYTGNRWQSDYVQPPRQTDGSYGTGFLLIKTG
jgi:RHS repeat-associated protein